MVQLNSDTERHNSFDIGTKLHIRGLQNTGLFPDKRKKFSNLQIAHVGSVIQLASYSAVIGVRVWGFGGFFSDFKATEV